MSAPILARFAAAGRHIVAATRALRASATDNAVTLPTIQDHQTIGWAHRRMSPQEVRMVLEQAAAGSLSAQYDLFSMMEDTWPRLAKNLGELRRAAARATYAAQPFAERGKPASESAKERAAFVDQCLRQWWPRPGTLELSFEDTLFNALDAYGKGVSVLEIHWERRPEGIMPRCAHVVAPRLWGWNREGTELGLVTERVWEPFPSDKFLVGMWQARTGAPGATAVLRALAPYWVGITFGWEWLLSNAQIFGVPFRWATYARDQPQLATQLRDMLAEMGASGYGAFPDGTQLNFKEAATNVTGNPQVVVQQLADKACDLLILGQELSGGAQAAGLGGGAADLQQGVRVDRLQAAAQWCADLLNYQLVPAILRANWGDTHEPPVVVGDVDDEPDPLKLAQRDQVLLNAGIELPRSWFYERHGIPEPVEGEAVIVGRAQAAPIDPFAPPGQMPQMQSFVRPPVVEPVQAKATDAAGVARESLFRVESLRMLKNAQVRALQPLIARMTAVADLEDDAAFSAGLAKLRADLPVLAREILSSDASGELTKAWESILGSALVSGAAEAAQRKR